MPYTQLQTIGTPGKRFSFVAKIPFIPAILDTTVESQTALRTIDTLTVVRGITSQTALRTIDTLTVVRGITSQTVVRKIEDL